MAKHTAKDATTKKPSAARKSASSLKVARDTSKNTIQKKKKHDPRQFMVKAIIVFFAVLMGVSVMLPTIAQVISSNSARQQAEDEYAEALAAQDAAGSGSSAVSYDFNTVDGILAAYSDRIAELEEELSEDPENLAKILNVAQAYMNCAYNAAQLASTDEEAAKIVSFFQTAESYFDQYLAIKETNAVKVNHALCELYQGNIEVAVNELRAITADSPDYAPAWMNLGMTYEVVSLNNQAIAAYAKAQETDPNNDYGARLFATNRITQLQSEMTSQELSYETGTSDQTEDNGVLQLWNDLNGTSSN